MVLTSDAPPLRSQLRDADLRVTAPRLAVLEALTRQPHSGADTLFRSVREQLPGTSVQAVYGVLGALIEAGLVRRIEPAGMSSLYELRVDDDHHHLVCTGCHTVRDVDCTVGEAPCLEPSDAHGFAIDQADVTFWGLCPACRDDRTHHPLTEGA